MNVWQFSWLVSALFVQALAMMLFALASRQWVRSAVRAFPFFLLLVSVPAEYSVVVVTFYLFFEILSSVFEVVPDILISLFGVS